VQTRDANKRRPKSKADRAQPADREILPLTETVANYATLDAIRAQIKLRYPGE